MIQIHTYISSLRPCMFDLRRCHRMKGCSTEAASRMMTMMKMKTTIATTSTNSKLPISVAVVRTFVASTTVTNHGNFLNNNHTLNMKVSSSSFQIRFQSSSSNATKMQQQQDVPQPTKYELPPNLTFDKRSHFLHMFDTTESIRHRVEEDDGTTTPMMSTAEAAAAVEQQQQRDENDSWYEDDVDDEDDDEELFDDEDSLIYPYQEGVVYAEPLPQRLHVEIHTLFRTPSLVGNIHLNSSVFGLDPIRIDLLKRSVDYYRAKKRGKRNAVTKTIHEVSGSGRKVRKQKGGGTSRAGHSRPPHFRGGAKAHGPKNNTDYGNIKLNKKVRTLATRHVLSQKLKEGNIILLNHMYELPTHKTNDLSRLLSPWKIGGLDGKSAIILDHYLQPPPNDDDDNNNNNNDPTLSIPSSHRGVPTNLRIAAKNIPRLMVVNSFSANVYDILKHEKLLITLSALEQLEARLKID